MHLLVPSISLPVVLPTFSRARPSINIVVSKRTNFAVIYPCFTPIFILTMQIMRPMPLLMGRALIDHDQGLGICRNKDSTSVPATV